MTVDVHNVSMLSNSEMQMHVRNKIASMPEKIMLLKTHARQGHHGPDTSEIFSGQFQM
jgi:hypothetical protein